VSVQNNYIIVVVPGGPFPSSQRYHLPPHL
jgi:hypothetical protein